MLRVSWLQNPQFAIFMLPALIKNTIFGKCCQTWLVGGGLGSLEWLDFHQQFLDVQTPTPT